MCTAASSVYTGVRHKKKWIEITVLVLALLVVTGSVIIIRNIQRDFSSSVDSRPNDKYKGKQINQENDWYIRGRFTKIKESTLYIDTNIDARLTKSEKIVNLSGNTTFQCVERYVTGPQGQKIDRADIFIDTSKLSPDQTPPPKSPDAKDLQWFKKQAESGDMIEVFLYTNSQGLREPFLVLLTRENCT